MAGASRDSPSSPPLIPSEKPLKTLAPELKFTSEQLEDGFESRQQDSPINDDSGSPVCGICLSGGGKSNSGRIDSCDHYFCFVCIMEWAKVESRCPMCKQRFTSIRRPPKHGVFAAERIVNVPQRDQIYHLCGNATTTRADPYAETCCMVCHSMADESFLLLCDLCDSAAHTYCVGLGYTIPEGDWFCHDCAVSRAEHEKTVLNVETENGIVPEEYAEPAPSDQKVSIVDIVRESDHDLLLRAHPRSTSFADQLLTSVSSGSGSILAAGEDRAATRKLGNIANSGVTESCARTLSRCRNVRRHIQNLRNNWDSLRNGSLRFSSGSGESSGGSSKRHNEGCWPVLLSPKKQQRAEDGHAGFSQLEKRDPYDIKKAWRMMEMATTVQNLRSNDGVCMVSKVRSGIGAKTEQPFKIRSSHHLSEQPKQSINRLETNQSTLQKLEKQKQIVGLSRLTVGSKRELPSSSLELHGHPLRKKVSVQTDFSGARTSAEYVHKKSLNPSHMQNGSSHFPNTADSPASQTKLDFASSSSSKLPIAEAKPGTEKTSARKLEKKNIDAKIEIQSLVKLNLKLLNKGKQIEVKTFKEIARISTHTILAACGLEHSKLRVRPFPSSLCNHGGQIQQIQMPNSCRECFYAFVSDVVQSVVDEKITSAM